MMVFKAEEEQRLGEIEVSQQSFEEYKIRDMGAWLRLKHNWNVWFGHKEVVEPFNAFAEKDCGRRVGAKEDVCGSCFDFALLLFLVCSWMCFHFLSFHVCSCIYEVPFVWK
jgi:hypothetical protein